MDPRFRPKEFYAGSSPVRHTKVDLISTTLKSKWSGFGLQMELKSISWNSSEVERLPEEQSVGGAIPSSSTKHSWRNSKRGGLQNRYTWGRHPPTAPFYCPIGLTNWALVYGTSEVGLTPAWDASFRRLKVRFSDSHSEDLGSIPSGNANTLIVQLVRTVDSKSTNASSSLAQCANNFMLCVVQWQNAWLRSR